MCCVFTAIHRKFDGTYDFLSGIWGFHCVGQPHARKFRIPGRLTFREDQCKRQVFRDTKNKGSVSTNSVAMEDSLDEWPKDWPKALFLRVYARTQLWDCGLTTTAKTLSCLNGDAVNTYLRLVSV